jgi:capsular polysaccharide biosynthesis protein
VALCVVSLGVLVPVAQSRSSDVYEARSQVGPTRPLVLKNLDPLPRFAQSVFSNGGVAQDVRQQLGLSADATVIPGRVELTTAQDNPVMVVVAKSSSPSTAAAVANKAAATFVVELNRYSGSVGTFAVQHSAVAPAKPAPKLAGGYWAVVVGLLAGLVAGLGVVGLILVLRRPVVGAAAAEAATGLPVLGTVRLPRNGPPDGHDLVGIGALARRLLIEGHEVVYVTGPVQSQVDQVSASISSVLAKARVGPPGTTASDGEDAATRPRRTSPTPDIVALETSSLEEWIATPDTGALTLLVVSEGIRARSLRTLVDQHASGTAAALALVALHRRGIRFASKRRREAALASQPG